jgi:hypothetical protein
MPVTDTKVRQAQVIVDLTALWRVNLVSMLALDSVVDSVLKALALFL